MHPALLDETSFDRFVSDHETVVIGFLTDGNEAPSFGRLAQSACGRTPEVAFGVVEHDCRAVLDMFGLSATATGIFRQRIVLYLEAGVPDSDRLGQLLDRIAALDISKVRAEIDEERARAALSTHLVCPTARRGKMP